MVRAEATAKYIRSSAQKAGLVLDLIRGKDVNLALSALQFSRKSVARDVAKVLRSAVERFGVLLLDQKQRVIRSVILSTGTVEACVSHPRDLFRVAMLAAASFVVAFHNHPSGDPTPSVHDRILTKRLRSAGELIGIELMDHIILGGDTFFSFRAEGIE